MLPNHIFLHYFLKMLFYGYIEVVPNIYEQQPKGKSQGILTTIIMTRTAPGYTVPGLLILR